MCLFHLRFPGFSPSIRPGFPCHLSGSVYSAFCQFPFALPCFAPTAVPQVLALFRFPFSPLPFSVFPFFSAFFRPLLFRFLLLGLPFLLFPLPCLPSRWFLRFLFRVLSILSDFFPASSVLSFPCDSFLRLLFRLTRATSAAGLLFPARPFPLAFALGSGYLAWVNTP